MQKNSASPAPPQQDEFDDDEEEEEEEEDGEGSTALVLYDFEGSTLTCSRIVIATK